MLDSIEELLRKIRLGEDSVLELKSVRFRGHRIAGPSRDDLADELAALANTNDGVCILSVDDKTREVEGIPLLPLRQATRNELIASLLARTPVDSLRGAGDHRYFMEKRGDGVPIILNDSLRLSGKLPEYRLIDDAELLLTIYSAELPNQIELRPEIE